MIKTIVGYEGRYEIDDLGNIYSNGKLMKTYKINSGYKAIKLQYKGKRYHYLIHRLVAEYFVNGEGDVVDHINGNKEDNRACNLRYCTQKENIHFYGIDHNAGIRHYKSKTTIDEVLKIRELREKYNMRNCDIYKVYPDKSRSVIDSILNYKSYKKIPC